MRDDQLRVSRCQRLKFPGVVVATMFELSVFAIYRPRENAKRPMTSLIPSESRPNMTLSPTQEQTSMAQFQER
jgi:hypothetical protein